MTLSLQYNTITERHAGGIKHLVLCTGAAAHLMVDCFAFFFKHKKYKACTLKGM